jgi:hypothetical protein
MERCTISRVNEHHAVFTENLELSTKQNTSITDNIIKRKVISIHFEDTKIGW